MLAVLLAPTDAALGQAVVTEPRLPVRIRQGLNVESGLNDGICVPLLLIVLAGAEVESEVFGNGEAGRIVLEEIGYGLAAGLAVGALAAAVVLEAGRRGLIAAGWRQVIPVAAALAYGVADPLGGSGFIAAFVAGMTFGHRVRRESGELGVLGEELGQILNGLTFIVFGAVLLGPALEDLSWSLGLYAVLSLTLVRMVPVAIALVGLRARPPTVAFLGWFGPRGLASIVFAVIVVEESHLPHLSTILLATYVTIGLSVLLHGLTAAPLADRYARWYEAHPRDRLPPAESVPAEVSRPRGPVPGGPPTRRSARAGGCTGDTARPAWGSRRTLDHRGDHHRGERGLGELLEQAGQEQQRDHGHHRAHDSGQLCLRP